MALISKTCGCKGIRSCLMCEKTKLKDTIQNKDDRNHVIYTYCPKCNLCIPEEESMSILYLGKILLVPNFITEDEESLLVSSIDQIAWNPSQSGRKKQDFGPKVNFKKKKVKIGDFKGFPAFTKDVIERMQSRKELMDFVPVELCHLEYTPDRGSSIEPHVDDFWLWGERLVTINLLSSTFLTLTPTCTSSCLDWPEKLHCSYDCLQGISVNSCKHKLNAAETQDNAKKDTTFEDFCSMYQKDVLSTFKVEVKIELPPRSLFMLSGCARYNWFHEIKRENVASRRLAMTYRELSEHFSSKGSDKDITCQLLEISNKFYNFNMNDVIET